MAAAKIKICGLMSEADAELVNLLGVEYAGIVMYFPKSHRSRTPEQARRIIGALRPEIKSVAVVVAPSAEQLREIEGCGFDIVQIHGSAAPEVYESVRLPVFKAFNVSDISDYEKFAEMDCISGFVFDAAQPGSGQTFNWSMLKTLPVSGKYTILAGGLNADNVSEAIEYLHPDIVDVSSGVEKDDKTGKSYDKAYRFVNAVRKVKKSR